MPTEKRPGIEFVETEFTYAIPDDFRETTFDQGKSGTYTYIGPRFITFEIDKETGKETGWCLVYQEELERPAPLNCIRVMVDCSLTENGLLCEIANDQGREDSVEFRANRNWITYYQAPEGYTSIEKPDAFEPRDIYDEFNVTYDFATGKFNIPLHSWNTDFSLEMTWDDVRKVRDRMLRDSDGMVSDDMPQSIKDQWYTYRNLLRDLPEKLKDFPPYIAAQMFPQTPE
jgi:hypothetical protein